MDRFWAIKMGRCSKWKLFSISVVFSAFNFLLYCYFSQPNAPVVIHFNLAANRHLTNIVPVATTSTSSNILQKVASIGEFTYSNFDSFPSVNSSFLIQNGSVLKYNGRTNELSDRSSSGVPNDTLEININPSGSLPMCPEMPPNLVGLLKTFMEASSWESLANANPQLQPGGRYFPPDCESRHRVAIVIPYRNREEHLKILLRNLHPMLKRQQLDYGIYVIDQALPGKFNRGMLMNIGYAEAMKRYNYQCVVFHDVDLVPENDKNIYSCPDMPRHLSAAVDKFKYRLPYNAIYGGVSVVRKEQFEKINGFSNFYFGWGGEDDDMSRRILAAKYKVIRYPLNIARYKMIKHKIDSGNEKNPKRHALLKSSYKRISKDGLNSLKYTVQEVEIFPTHLRIQVYINETLVLQTKI